MNKSYYAVFTLVGTIIGAGIFGLPYIAAKTGIVPTIVYLIFLSAVTVLLHLLYGETVLRTNGNRRLVGYAGLYLGRWGKRMASFSVIIGSYAALLAYIILGGIFLKTLLGGFFGGTELHYSLIIFFFSAFFIAKGLKMISWLELYLSVFMIAAIIIFLFKGLFAINASNFNLGANWKELFLPYGVILFALNGASVIPEIVKILEYKKSQLKKTIIIGTLIPAVIYFLFILVVFGVSGQNTSQDAISGLVQSYGNSIVFLGALIGFLAIITSFLAFGENLKKTFEYDYNIPKVASLFCALFIPLILFLIGINDFISVIGFAGAVTGGIDGILIILAYRKADRYGRGDRKPEYDVATTKWSEYLLIVMFILGIIYTIWNLK